MGNLTATNQWVDVPYFEPNAVLTGGPDCPDNVPIQALTDRTEYLKGMVDQQNQGKLDKSGGAMTGTLLLKLGAVTPGNVNNAGLSFAGDGDTGVFSARDGNLQIASNGQVVIELDDMSPSYFRRGVRTPKGAPVGADVNASSGYTFGGDGDTGLFAEGGSDGGGSDLVMRVDNVDFVRITNGRGVVLSGTTQAPTPSDAANDGQIATTFFVQRALASMLAAPIGAATGGAASGWCRLPGGLILQWGVVAYGNRNAAVNVAFPITFPHAVLSLQHSTADGEGEVVSVGAGNPSTSGASFILRGVYGTAPDGGVLHYTVLGY